MSRTIEMQQRRIEIVGMTALHPNRYSIGDFANIFDIDEEMLKKDFQALRKDGITIHQIRNQGISILKEMNADTIDYFLQQYMVLSRAEAKKDRLLTQMVKKNGKFAIGLIVALQRGIRERTKVEFDYKQSKAEAVRSYSVDPLMLFQREGLWRLLAQIDGSILQFHIAKIISVSLTTKKISRPDQQVIDDQFKYSWNTWTSGDKIPIRLQLTDFWAERLSARPAVEDQTIARRGDDDHIFEGTVNSIEEIARWIVGRSGDVIVLSPESLRKKVRQYAQECLKKHTD